MGASSDTVLTHLVAKAKKFTEDREVQHEVLTNLLSKAKECNGDGEVQHGVPTNFLSKAKKLNGDGEVNAADMALLLAQWGVCTQ